MIKIYVRGRKHILSFIKIQVCELNIFRDYNLKRLEGTLP